MFICKQVTACCSDYQCTSLKDSVNSNLKAVLILQNCNKVIFSFLVSNKRQLPDNSGNFLNEQVCFQGEKLNELVSILFFCLNLKFIYHQKRQGGGKKRKKNHLCGFHSKIKGALHLSRFTSLFIWQGGRLPFWLLHCKICIKLFQDIT